MSDSDKQKSVRAWEDFSARCQIGKAERRRIIERKQERRQQVKEAK